MNEMKNLALLAGVVVACGVMTGCTSNKAQAPTGNGKLTLLSDRGVMPGPYRNPEDVKIHATAVSTQPRQVSAVSEDENLESAGGDSEAVFVPADSTQQPEAVTPQFQSDYAKPEDASPTKAPAAKAAPAPQAPKRKYKVVKGDTLSDIGYIYQISWRDIAAENNMTGKETLHEGQVLVLPDSAAETPRPRQVRKAAAKPATPPAAKKGAAAPAKNPPAAGNAAKSDAAKPAKANALPPGGVYTVVEGDSLWLICHRFGLKSDDVRALNPTVNFKNLQIGQKIMLPSGKAVKAAAADAPAKNDAPKPPKPSKPATPPALPEDTDVPPPPQPKPATPPAPPAEEPNVPPAPAPNAPAPAKVTVPDLPQFNDFTPEQPQVTPVPPANNVEPPPLP